jgi:hypothetical protein
LPPRLDQLNANGEFLLYAEYTDKSFQFGYLDFVGIKYLRSSVVTINPQAEVLTFTVPENDFTTYNTVNLASAVTFYSNANGTGSSQFIRLDNLDDTLSVNKTYIVYFDDLNFNPLSARLQLTTDLTTALPPDNYLPFMNLNTNYDFTAPRSVIYYDGLNIFYSAYFVRNVPEPPTTPTRNNFTFNRWNDINGNEFIFPGPPLGDQLTDDDQLLLYSNFVQTLPDNFLPDDFNMPAIQTPIAVLLNNTGFYTVEGLMLLFVILIIAANVALWYFKTPLFVNLIVISIILTLFMTAGYLPVFVVIPFIGLLILLFFNLKGGLTNE